MVQRVIERLSRRTMLAQQIREDAWVYAAGAGAHHQPLQRRKAHRRVHAAATGDRRERATVAQVASDEPQVSEVAPQELRGALGAVLVADAVEAEAANALLEPGIGAGIDRGSKRHMGV